jgi:hypothetical protein
MAPRKCRLGELDVDIWLPRAGRSGNLIGVRSSALRTQPLISLILLIGGMYGAWKLGQWIASGDLRDLLYFTFVVAICAIAITIARNWRAGFYLFLVWLLFEDLIRKYAGNNMAIYFVKDALAGLTYAALYLAVRQGRAKVFRPRSLLAFSLFFWLAALQIFNPYSPSVLYGFLGMKIDFYYVPLLFVGYALIRNEAELRRFLLAFMTLTLLISLLGIAQATVGSQLLSPATLAPNLQKLGNLQKVAPLTDQIFLLPTSVFVSTGRFAFFLVLATIVGLGAAGYFILSAISGRLVIFASIALLAVAVMLSGSRTAFLYSLISLAALTALFLWGAPRRWGEGNRLLKAIRRSAIFAVMGLAIFVTLFPSAASSRWSFYLQTLSPNSSAYVLTDRAWDYPIQNLEDAFYEPHWVVGNGLGTASLGIQYVSQFLGKPEPNVWVEEGFGQLVVELGILGPILWIAWTAVLLWVAWKTIRPLRHSRLFPIAIAILWYAFVLLYPLTYLGLDIFQNYVNNAFLWILLGILFRLPSLAMEGQADIRSEIPQSESSSFVA